MHMFQKTWSRLNCPLFLMAIDSAHSESPSIRQAPEFHIASNPAVPNQ